MVALSAPFLLVLGATLHATSAPAGAAPGDVHINVGSNAGDLGVQVVAGKSRGREVFLVAQPGQRIRFKVDRTLTADLAYGCTAQFPGQWVVRGVGYPIGGQPVPDPDRTLQEADFIVPAGTADQMLSIEASFDYWCPF
jgi:hypothetical protein